MRATIGKIIFLLALVLLPAAGAAPTPDEIAQAIQNLGADNFKTREQATLFLWNAGHAAEPALRQASANPDPEVAVRAREVLESIRNEISPESPKTFKPLVEQYRHADADRKLAIMDELLKHRLVGARVVESLLECESDEGFLQHASERIRKQYVEKFSDWILNGQWDQAEALLALGALMPEPTGANGCYNFAANQRNYAAFLWMQGRLPEKIQVYRSKFDQGGCPSLARLLAILYRADGDLPQARWAAEKSNDFFLRVGILAELGQWAEIAKLQEQRMHQSEPPDGQPTPECLAMYHRLAGHTEVVEKHLKNLWMAVRDGNAPVGPAPDPVPSFIFNGQPDHGIACEPESYRAFGYLCAQRQFRAALQLAERTGRGFPETEVYTQCQVARTLFRLGERERTTQLLQLLAEECYSYNPIDITATAIETECHEVARTVLARSSMSLLDTNDITQFWFPWSWCHPDRRAAVDPCWRVLLRCHAQDSLETTLSTLRMLINRPKSVKESPTVITEASEGASLLPQAQRAPALAALAGLAADAGLTDLALMDYQLADHVAEKQRGLLLLSLRRWDEAADCFAKAWEQQKDADALVLQGWALRQVGRVADGDRLIRAAIFICPAYFSLIPRARELGLADFEQKRLEVVRRTGEFFPDCESPEPLLLARAEAARGDYFQAAARGERLDVCLVCGVANNEHRPNARYSFENNLRDRYRIHYWRAKGFLAAKQLTQALRELQLGRDYWPGDVNVPLDVVPELDRQGHKQEADEIFDAVWQFLDKTCAEFPRWAEGRYDLSRLAARCGRKLDEALAHGLKAVELEPANAAYFATLAEVRFARGEREQAVELMKQCVKLDEKNEAWAKRLKEFEAGK